MGRVRDKRERIWRLTVKGKVDDEKEERGRVLIEDG